MNTRRGAGEIAGLIMVVGMLVLLGVVLVKGCSQTFAKHFGGTTTVNLPVNTKLVTVTWKDSNLWYLTRPMKDGELPETTTFKEQATLGILNGTVILVESRK